jgi:hypothetical protein
MSAIMTAGGMRRRVTGRDVGSTLWRRGKRPGRIARGGQTTTLEDC